jgi:CRP-like cAMP-binding protein
VSAIRLGKTAFSDIVTGNPTLADDLSAWTTGQLVEANAIRTGIANDQMPGRLLVFLRSPTRNHADGVELPAYLTLDERAGVIGTSRPSLARAILTLRKSRLLAPRRESRHTK